MNMNERIYLLTGAAGFLGSNICLQLLEKGCKVRALIPKNSSEAPQKAARCCLFCWDRVLCESAASSAKDRSRRQAARSVP